MQRTGMCRIGDRGGEWITSLRINRERGPVTGSVIAVMDTAILDVIHRTRSARRAGCGLAAD